MTLTVNLELTDHCNIKCTMCSQSLRDEAHGVPMRFMEWETWRAALLGLETMPESVALCPHWLGEPTIHPEFDRFIEYAFAINGDNRLFREFKLHTNGVVFGEARAQLLLRLAAVRWMAPDTFRFVHFSIDAHSPEVYAKVKGAPRGEQVYANVERFLRLREFLGLKGPKVTLAFVVQPGNHHEAGDFLAHWSSVLESHGRLWKATWDWPDECIDTVYFRPLNCGQQDEADELHARVCRDLGLVVSETSGRLRAAQSF